MNKKVQFQNVVAGIIEGLHVETSCHENLECAQVVITTLGDESDNQYILKDKADTIDRKPLYEIFEEDSWHIYFKESVSDRLLEPDFSQFQYQYEIYQKENK